jgi:hypothetical protein
VTPIRPSTTSLPQALPQSRPELRNAQRAFFEAAMGRAAPAEPAQPASRTERRPQGLDLTKPPEKILRPGSLLDIKV